jgi:hypothetical protein
LLAGQEHGPTIPLADIQSRVGAFVRPSDHNFYRVIVLAAFISMRPAKAAAGCCPQSERPGAIDGDTVRHYSRVVRLVMIARRDTST